VPRARQPGEAPLRIDADGWLAGVPRGVTPHRDARPPQARIELLVIHCISLPPGEFGLAAIEALFAGTLDPAAHPAYAPLQGLRVSAHFLVDRNGGLRQFVSCRERAWHAGRSEWNGRAACNDFSIGVELVGSEFEAFTASQYRTLAALQACLCAAYPIRATRGHSEIAPGRKFDPGPYFDWSRLARDTPPGPSPLPLSLPDVE
jgi:AmpD protein